ARPASADRCALAFAAHGNNDRRFRRAPGRITTHFRQRQFARPVAGRAVFVVRVGAAWRGTVVPGYTALRFSRTCYRGDDLRTDDPRAADRRSQRRLAAETGTASRRLWL